MYFSSMSSMLVSLIFLWSFGARAQYVVIAGSQFDVSPCVDPQDTFTCYQQAQAHYVNTGETLCNTTSGINGDCVMAASENFEQSTLGCMISYCWNMIYSCAFQFMISSYVFDSIIEGSSGANNPPFSPLDYMDSPGSCICNLPIAQLEIYTTPTTTCVLLEESLDPNCECCVYAQRLASLYTTCPNNTLNPIGFESWFSSLVNSAQTNCPIFTDSNWLDNLQQTCPGLKIDPIGSVGYVNPLSLPAGFPGTAPLTDIPGEITALSQYNITESTFAVAWVNGYTPTYTFVSADVVLATSAQAGDVGTPIGSVTATPGISSGGFSSGVAAVGVSTHAVTTGKSTATTHGTNGQSGTSTEAAASATSTKSGSDKVMVSSLLVLTLFAGLLSM